MKKKGLLLLLLPFVIMTIINEGCRLINKENNLYMLKCLNTKVKTLNSDERTSDKCTWICHNDTWYCMDHHVKAKSLRMTEKQQLYFGEIKLLKSFDAYALTNILVYVIAFPIWWLSWLIKIIRICSKR
jgi:hypothetical protein